tara:strand:+ start:143 stop:673 length:531 start_codon:yes stop_codon:yes gene_type:complete
MAKVVLHERFVFKVANEVLSLSDLKSTKSEIETLQCMYPDSLIHRIFSKDFQAGNLEGIKIETDFKAKEIKYFETLIPFFKLMAYSKSHDVTVKPALKKYFKLSAKQNNCDLKVFDDDGFTEQFEYLVRMEVFVRSRFLPSESQGKSNSSDIEKAVVGARNLITSIDQQIDEEAYW